MDIDSPPSNYLDPHAHDGHQHLLLPPLSASFPLPFRVLVLIGFAILLWGTNLHILHLLGIDAGWILDFRDGPDELGLPKTNPHTSNHSGNLGVGLGVNGSAEEMELEEYIDTPVKIKAKAGGLAGTSLGLGTSAATSGAGAASHSEAGQELERELESDTPTRAISPNRALPAPRVDSAKLHQPIYKLFLLYSIWVGAGWLLFRLVTGGEVESMERWRGLIALVVVGAGAGVVLPWRGVGERERRALNRCVKRIFMPPLNSPIFFCDVILADILTSFAKVLGDLWVSACQLWSGGITQGRVTQSGWSRWITLSMVCLPYMLRFRQCLHEFHQSGYTSPRPLANSLKYFSAFPVILLSAAQKIVVNEIAQQKGMTIEELGQTHDRWFGEHRLFRLWLLAVVVNSMFSFYWDVQMDWGLALCEVDTWLPKRDAAGGATPGLLGTPRDIRDRDREKLGLPGARRTADLSIWAKTKKLFFRNNISHQRSPHPSPGPFASHSHSPSYSLSHARSLSFDTHSTTSSKFFSFGLRPNLLLPDPLVYHIFTLIDLVLRFTWSLKLSSHLHTISEIETGVFLMEGLELVRRWMWIFVRIEWEGVKMGEVARFASAANSHGAAIPPGGMGPGLASGSGPGSGPGQVLWMSDEVDKP